MGGFVLPKPSRNTCVTDQCQCRDSKEREREREKKKKESSSSTRNKMINKKDNTRQMHMDDHF